MRCFLSIARRSLYGALLLGLAWGGVALGANYGPLQIQNYGADIDNPALFWTNIGGGAAGKLSIGAGLSNNAGALQAAVQTVFGRTGAVALQSGDVTTALGFTPATALGYTPLNKGGDVATGLIGFSVSATASAAGSTQGTCAAITAQTTIFTTVAPSTGACLNSTVGVPQTVANAGANVLSIYPPSGAAIEGLSTNAAAGVAVGGRTTFTLVTSTQAYAK